MPLLIILIISLVISPASLADLNASLNDMFTRYGARVNVTNPGAYDAQTRGFIVGGSMSARMQQDTMQVASLKLPSITAGCGGIDIFGGAFSFINAEQFTAFLRKVGQNALGYAFSLGLEAVCPTCLNQIKWLKNMVDMVNKGSLDSCFAAKALVNSAGSGLGLLSMEKCKERYMQVPGQEGDATMATLSCGAAGGEAEIRAKLHETALLNTAEATTKGTTGKLKGAVTKEVARGSGLTTDQRQLMVSIMGTWYTPADDDFCRYKSASITLADLVEGGDLKLLKCGGTGGFGDNDECNDVTEVIVATDGFAKQSRLKMQSILNKYRNKTDNLTDDEKEFVNAIAVPPVAYMLKHSLAYSEDLANALIDLTSEVAGAMMAWQTIENYVKLFSEGTTSVGDLCSLTSADFQSEIRKARDSRTELYAKYMKGLEMQATIVNYMAHIDAKVAASMPAAAFRVNKS